MLHTKKQDEIKKNASWYNIGGSNNHGCTLCGGERKLAVPQVYNAPTPLSHSFCAPDDSNRFKVILIQFNTIYIVYNIVVT